jgi:uncharacterized protein YmfQ (DUF2313 family)
VSLAASAYARQLKALLPRGLLWSAPADGVLDRMLRGFSDELVRVDARGDDLIREADPRTTNQLLVDFERVLGLPDSCVSDNQSVAERRLAVVAKITNLGGQSRQFFIDVAAAAGYTVTLTEFRPLICEMDCESPVCDDDWAFAWQVNGALNTVLESTCESPCEDPLGSWGNERLECVIERYKPAHTVVLFSYT